jgi:hypothetical protein
MLDETALANRMREEIGQPLKFWFLSFAKGSRDTWRGFICEAPGFAHAFHFASITGCNPGGEVMGMTIPAEELPAKEHHNKLFTVEEAEVFWGPMKTTTQWDQEASR